MDFKYKVGDKVRFANGEDAEILTISFTDDGMYQVEFDCNVLGYLNGNREKCFHYDHSGKKINVYRCDYTMLNHIVGLVDEVPVDKHVCRFCKTEFTESKFKDDCEKECKRHRERQPQEIKPMQTVAEFIKDLPFNTEVTNGVTSWDVAQDDEYNRYLSGKTRYDLDISAAACQVCVIPNIHVKKKKVLKGRVLCTNGPEYLPYVTDANYTEKEFKKQHYFTEFIRILTEVPEFPTEEVEEI